MLELELVRKTVAEETENETHHINMRQIRE